MKTMNLKLSNQSASKSYDKDGIESGSSTSMSYRIVVVEDNTEVGSVNYNFNMNYYGQSDDVDYSMAKETLEAKIKSAIEAFNNALIM